MKIPSIPQNRISLYIFYILVSNAGTPIPYEFFRSLSPSYDRQQNIMCAVSVLRPLLAENGYQVENIRGFGYKAVKRTK